jgi:hypothetical protein
LWREEPLWQAWALRWRSRCELLGERALLHERCEPLRRCLAGLDLPPQHPQELVQRGLKLVLEERPLVSRLCRRQRTEEGGTLALALLFKEVSEDVATERVLEKVCRVLCHGLDSESAAEAAYATT